jgi:tartrate dehydratase alpha subunit/fumarate hydratase class I-like protein
VKKISLGVMTLSDEMASHMGHAHCEPPQHGVRVVVQACKTEESSNSQYLVVQLVVNKEVALIARGFG